MNADVLAKVATSVIGKSKKHRCFDAQKPPVAYFSQSNAWSDSKTFGKWWEVEFRLFGV